MGWLSVLGEARLWDLSCVSLSAEGIMTFIKIPSFNDLTAFGFKAESQL